MGLRRAEYQLVALTKLLLPHGGQLLISDGVGVGKTISAGYCIHWTLTVEGKNAVVVCPVSLVDKWLLELRDKFGVEAHAIRSQEELVTAAIESERTPKPRAYVLSASRISLEPPFEIGLLVVDEIHNYRNPATASWRHLRRLARLSKRRIGLTATPINNKPEDLFSIYAILYAEFPRLAVESAFQFLWESRAHEVLNRLITRFEKESLGIHFAKRRIHHVVTEYPPKYVNEIIDTVKRLTGRHVANGRFPLETITYFRAGASAPPTFAKATHTKVADFPDPKLLQLQEILDKVHRQVLIFCQFKETIDYLAMRLAVLGMNPYVLTGDVPGTDRQGIIKQFQRDPRGMILLTAVGAEGLDMQFCDVVINYDLHWNPMVLEQRIGRIDRVGQAKDEIQIFNFHVRGSIDERILRVMAKKLDAVKGTPFEASSGSAGGPRMYDDLALKHEEKDAHTLAASLRALRQLTSSDIEILPYLKPEYCSPKKMALASPLDWVDLTDPTGIDWHARTDSAFQVVLTHLRDSTKLVST